MAIPTFSNSRLDLPKGFLLDTSQEGIGTTTCYERENQSSFSFCIHT